MTKIHYVTILCVYVLPHPKGRNITETSCDDQIQGSVEQLCF